MKARNKWLVGVVALLLIVLGAVVPTGRREPSYQGKSLSYWVLKAGAEITTVTPAWVPPRYEVSPEVEAAIQAIGTNGIPFYMEWMAERTEGPLDKAQIHLARITRKFFPHRWRPGIKDLYLKFGSTVVLSVLGEKDDSTVPILINYATNRMVSSPSDRQMRAFACLACTGNRALPALFELMTNASPDVRMWSVGWASSISTNAHVIEHLAARLDDPAAAVRTEATNGLRRIGASLSEKNTQATKGGTKD